MNIRSYEPADIEDVVALLNQCLTTDPISSEVFQLKVLLDQDFDLRGTLVACADGCIVGFALGVTRKFIIENAVPDFDRSWITLLAVDPAYRRQGIATHLLLKLEEYFMLSNCASTWVASYAPNYFIPGVDIAAYPEAMKFFKKMGFDEFCKPLAMDADLTQLNSHGWIYEKEKKLAEDGIVVENYRPELIQPLLDFLHAEFPGDWQRLARDAMTKITTGEYYSTNLWVAHRRGKALGYVQHDNQHRLGPFGVAARERGRGIGAVLLLRIMDAMRSKGMDNAWLLWTDDKAAELYSALGFVETRRFAILKKNL